MSKKKTGRTRHVPLRTCAACRGKYEKRQLTRLVRTADAGVVVDRTGKLNGRGAYLCDQVTCWDKALLTPAILNKALNTEILEEELAEIARHRPSD